MQKFIVRHALRTTLMSLVIVQWIDPACVHAGWLADHVLESISGHLSRRMLEHDSHIRIDAKRQVLDALDNARRLAAPNGNGGDKPSNNTDSRRSWRSATTSRHSHVTVAVERVPAVR
jgi:hypothetical protein